MKFGCDLSSLQYHSDAENRPYCPRAALGRLELAIAVNKWLSIEDPRTGCKEQPWLYLEGWSGKVRVLSLCRNPAGCELLCRIAREVMTA